MKKKEETLKFIIIKNYSPVRKYELLKELGGPFDSIKKAILSFFKR